MYFKGCTRMIKEFCNNTSLSGYKYMVERKRSYFERGLWIVCHVILMTITVYLITNLWFSFMENPTVTTLQTRSYPVRKVEFPGVSICNINKISLKRAVTFATYLANLSNHPVDDILQKLYLFGSMYDFDSSDSEKFVKVQSFFDNLNEISEVSLHPKDILRSLITPCEELLKLCRWGGKIVNCTEIFEFRLTFEGYCCTFNYIKEENSFSANKSTNQNKKKIKHQDSGYEKGLTLIINNNPEDYFYSLIATVGISVHIFSANDYPDEASGSMLREVIGHGTETFLSVIPTIFESLNSVMNYPIEKRKCLFPEERTTIFGEYSESDCLVDCRIKSMLALCECIPFMIPVEGVDNVCTLPDIPCLNRYRYKWNSLKPSDIVGDDLNREIHDSLYCDSRCYPACGTTVYAVTTNTVSLQLKNRKTVVEQNNSVVHLYFRKPFVHLYKQDVVYYWFEILSNFGGTFGLMIGLSLISVIEVVVYFIYKCIIYSRNQ